ncbi:hypothetical protein [Streptomyces sp. FH025]|uniref:hypothetical protein n=1 Tax=Streptomyces sp. FH025 TaxID=2815937 RepID=UPI001A9DC8E9|nr:hypothetical protein [Streptomyces sp. FH025]MBO1417742.1 hypothetical protein [Streptomyces sp. FH025]
MWEGLLRATVPVGPVREAVPSSSLWPEIAATMQKLRERGVGVRRLLAAAYAEGSVSIGRSTGCPMPFGGRWVRDAVRRSVGARSRDSVRSCGPLTVGLDLPGDLDLADRRRALAQLGVGQAENARFVRWVHEAMPGREREAALLVNSRQ